MVLQQPCLFQMRSSDTPVDSEENMNPPVSNQDPRVKKTKSVPDAVKTVQGVPELGEQLLIDDSAKPVNQMT